MEMIIVFLSIFFTQYFNQVNSLTSDYDVTNDLQQKKNFTVGRELLYRIEKDDNFSIDATEYFNGSQLSHSFECSFRFNQSKLNDLVGLNFTLINLQDDLNRFRLSVKFSQHEKIIQWELERNEMLTIHKFQINNIDIFDGKWHNFKYLLYKPSFCGIRLKVFLDCRNMQRTSIYTRGTDLNFNKKLFVNQLNFSIGHDNNGIGSIPLDLKVMKFSKNLTENLHKCCTLQHQVPLCSNNLNSSNSPIFSKSKLISRRSEDYQKFLNDEINKNIDDIKINEDTEHEDKENTNYTENIMKIFKKRTLPPVIIILYFMFCFGLVFLLLLKRSC